MIAPQDVPPNAPPLPPWQWPHAAYLHIPFCAHHCGYCDFAVAVGMDHEVDAYLDALGSELARLHEPQAIDTLFFGGGTPSLLNLHQTARLFDLVDRWLPRREHSETSLEANPDDVSEEKVRLWTERGVTRLSLGAQSFQPHLLNILERKHRPEQVPQAVERARDVGLDVGLDLIFAIPGQTMSAWEQDVGGLLALLPDHVSTYGLTYEKGTRLWKQRASGKVQALDEEDELRFYLCGREMLAAAGVEHYEVSNFARPEKRCRHNLVYWANHAYFGFGMGAASYVQGTRRLNTRNLASYVKKAREGRPLHFQEETLAPRERALETAAIQLRRMEGIDLSSFLTQTGFSFEDLAARFIQAMRELELLLVTHENVRLTQRGLCVADAVIQELFTPQKD